MKEPIEPSEIRAGDLVRLENRSPSGREETAHEFRAQIAADNDGWIRDRFNWFLLDRPKPAVVLPIEPTLGWIDSTFDSGDLDFWRHRDADDRGGEGAWAGNDQNGKPRGYAMGLITAFTPATAVPTEALEKLRANPLPQHEIRVFLAAVDAANGATS